MKCWEPMFPTTPQLFFWRVKCYQYNTGKLTWCCIHISTNFWKRFQILRVTYSTLLPYCKSMYFLGTFFTINQARLIISQIQVENWTYFYNSASFDMSHYILHISTKKSKFWLIAVEQHWTTLKTTLFWLFCSHRKYIVWHIKQCGIVEVSSIFYVDLI